MTNYIVLFLIALGMTNIFQLVMIIYVLYLIAILFSFYLPDRFGRRPMLMGGAAVCAATLTITCGINVAYGDSITDMAQKAALGMIFICALLPYLSSLPSHLPCAPLTLFYRVLLLRTRLVASGLDHLHRGLLRPGA